MIPIAGSLSDSFENAILEYALRGTDISTWVPGTVYVGLWTAALADASTGATAGEVSGGSYARIALARASGSWDAAAGGTVKNTGVVNFGTASADWGTVTHAAILNAAAVGTILYHWDLTASKTIQNGDPVQFSGSAITITQA